MKSTVVVVMLAGATVSFGLIGQSGSAQAPTVFKPVASVDGLMHGQGLVFKELQATVMNAKAKERGEHIELYAEALAELANVNTYNSDKEDYRTWAGEVRDNSMELSREAKKDALDEAKIKQLLSKIKDTCASCHDVYQK